MLTKRLDLVNIAIIVLTIILLSLWATDVGAQVGPVPTATSTPFAPPAGPQATLTPFEPTPTNTFVPTPTNTRRPTATPVILPLRRFVYLPIVRK